MAYVVGPVVTNRVTVLLTEEAPHTSCDKAAAAATMKPALTIRAFDAYKSGFTIKTPGKVVADGTAPWVHFTGKDSGGIDLIGTFTINDRSTTIPLKGEVAHMKLDFKGGNVAISGEAQALVCVTKDEMR